MEDDCDGDEVGEDESIETERCDDGEGFRGTDDYQAHDRGEE